MEVIYIPAKKDLTGNVYGELTVVDMLYGFKNNHTYCKCIGIDNNEYIIRADALQRGITKSIKGAAKPNISKNLSDMKFGKLTPLFQTDNRASNGSIIWHCICDCGNFIDVPSGNLLRGHTLSCGCRKDSRWENF